MELTIIIISVFLVIGLAATIDLAHPAISKQNNLEYMWAYYLSSFCIFTLLAPFLVPVLLNNTKREIFVITFSKNVFKD